MKLVCHLLMLNLASAGILLSGCQNQGTKTGQTNADFPGFENIPASQTQVLNSNDLPETSVQNHLIWDSYYNGGGVSVGDINRDGLPDLYFTNTMKENALYLNKGNWVFEDVTATAGVGGGQGVNWGSTMADINGDGWLDIYLCKSGVETDPAFTSNKCYINNGDGTFKEQAQRMGIDNAGFSVQAAFFDYDLDQDLDLFVMNQPSNARLVRETYMKGNDKDHISPATSNRLFRNDGGMRFTDVSAAAGVESFVYGLGLKICDLNGDHLPDVYVASDYDWPDQLFINQGNGTFVNRILDYFDHISNFSMGMDIGDINNDALDDIFVLDMAGIDHLRSKTNMPSMSPANFWKIVEQGKHYQYMHNVLQLNRGHEKFSDISYLAGVSKTDWSWGVLMMDADNDGFQDIYATNGIKRDIRNSDYIQKFKEMVDKGTAPADPLAIIQMIPSTPLANFMFHNDGDLHFSDKANAWGLGQPGFSNGCAYADLDKDGDLDIIVNNVDAPASLYKNKAEKAKTNYIQFELTSSKTKRPVEGTRIHLYAEGQLVQTQYYHPVRGFMSSSEPLVHFGLGARTSLDSAVLLWPDLNVSVITSPATNKRHVIDQDATPKVRRYKPTSAMGDWVTEDRSAITPAYAHVENDYDDYAHQILLPFRMSTLGPALAVGDVNADGLDDFFVGGAAGQSGALYLQGAEGAFSKSAAQPWSSHTKSDMLGALFFDADADSDLDLYIATGGTELPVGDPAYIDHLYINNGKGIFTVSNALPDMPVSSMAIAAGDWDKDGDADLFIGSRNTPRRYPYADKSYFLRNDGGRWSDVTSDVYNGDAAMGMITDAVMVDRDKDGDLDILYCGDWMAPTWLTNDGGRFTKPESADLGSHAGWWNTVEVMDFNGDGHLDILAGNAGTNNKFKATREEPFIVMASDFDHNGASDIVLATHFDGKEVPVRGRECSSQQLPYIAQQFPTYEGFAKASLEEIIGKDKLEGSLRLELTEFRSGIFWGTAEGGYRFEAFPVEAQLSPMVGFSFTDITGDGKPEVLSAGNLFDTEVETTRYDAGQGVVMRWDAASGWKCHTPLETGLYAGGNVRALLPIQSKGQSCVLMARGNGPVTLYRVRGGEVQ